MRFRSVGYRTAADNTSRVENDRLQCGKVHYRQVADMCKIQIQITHTARSVAHRLFPTRPVCLPACLPHKTPLSITYQIVMICAHYCASVYCIIIVNNNRSYHIAHRDSKNAALSKRQIGFSILNATSAQLTLHVLHHHFLLLLSC